MLKKIVLSMVFFFYILLLAELSLRFLASFYSWRVFRQSRSTQRDNVYRIDCFGDSHVFGMGAPLGMGFPEQLQKLLDRYADSNMTFQVRNRGQPGYNSSQVLEFMKKRAFDDPPDLIIVWAGINNRWNLQESNIHELIPPESIMSAIYHYSFLAIQDIRLYKAGMYLVKGADFERWREPNTSDSYRELLLSAESQRILIQHDYEKMKQFADRLGCEILFIAYPFYRTVTEVLEQEEYHFIDTKPIFESTLPLQLIYRADDHPNVIGYHLIAWQALYYLVDHKMLPVTYYKKSFSTNNVYFKQRSFLKIIKQFFGNLGRVEPIDELSPLSDKYERIRPNDASFRFELILKNGEPFMINNRDEAFKSKYHALPQTQLPALLFKYLFGEPHQVIESSTDEDYAQVLDELWIYKDNGTEYRALINNEKVKQVFFGYTLSNGSLIAPGVIQYGMDQEQFFILFGEPECRLLVQEPKGIEVWVFSRYLVFFHNRKLSQVCRFTNEIFEDDSFGYESCKRGELKLKDFINTFDYRLNPVESIYHRDRMIRLIEDPYQGAVYDFDPITSLLVKDNNGIIEMFIPTVYDKTAKPGTEELIFIERPRGNTYYYIHVDELEIMIDSSTNQVIEVMRCLAR